MTVVRQRKASLVDATSNLDVVVGSLLAWVTIAGGGLEGMEDSVACEAFSKRNDIKNTFELKKKSILESYELTIVDE